MFDNSIRRPGFFSFSNFIITFSPAARLGGDRSRFLQLNNTHNASCMRLSRFWVVFAFYHFGTSFVITSTVVLIRLLIISWQTNTSCCNWCWSVVRQRRENVISNKYSFGKVHTTLGLPVALRIMRARKILHKSIFSGEFFQLVSRKLWTISDTNYSGTPQSANIFFIFLINCELVVVGRYVISEYQE